MKPGDKVRVRDDAKAMGLGGSWPSTYCGETGTVIHTEPIHQYEVSVWMDKDGPMPETKPSGAGFMFSELEVIE